MLDVIVVNYNTAHLLERMFATCDAAAQGMDIRYWVVDNASRDDSLEVLRRNHPQAFVQANSVNVGFGRANNQMLEHLTGDFVLLLNTDAFMQPHALRVALDVMRRHPRCGVVGVRLEGEDASLQPSCRYFPTPWNTFLQRTGLARLIPWVRMVDDMAWDHVGERECDWVPGCFFLMRKAVIDQVGLFDPRFFLYSEEVDLCKRVKAAGWTVMYTGAASVIHLGGESAKSEKPITTVGRQISDLQIESELLFYRKYYGFLGVVFHLFLVFFYCFFKSVKKILFRKKYLDQGYFLLFFSVIKKTKFGLLSTR